MKAARVTVKPNSKGKTFTLFNDVAPLCSWLETGAFSETAVSRFLLQANDYFEVEWFGCEFVPIKGNVFRIDLVRLAKVSYPSNSAGTQITSFFGWVTPDSLPVRNFEDDDIVVLGISNPDDMKLDLAAIFQDPPAPPPATVG